MIYLIGFVAFLLLIENRIEYFLRTNLLEQFKWVKQKNEFVFLCYCFIIQAEFKCRSDLFLNEREINI